MPSRVICNSEVAYYAEQEAYGTAAGTLLLLTESGFDRIPALRFADAMRMNDNGWAQQMQNIEAYVAQNPEWSPTRQPWHALFAAMGDETRLAIIARLSSGEPRSIAQLTEGLRVTRQAITKHLRVLQRVGMVHSMRSGRESLFRFDVEPLREMHQYLNDISRQWDQALARLKALVEE
ncbi:MAG TPA: metalloregulator ArsR/SmtB family transcription factor [Acidobacteriaceae bacterium]